MRVPQPAIVAGTLVLVVLPLTTSCGDNKLKLSNGSAKEIINAAWNDRGVDFVYPVGELAVVRPGYPTEWQKNQVGYELFTKGYAALQRLGYISINSIDDLSAKFTGWDGFYALSQRGVQLRASVTPTKLGEKFLKDGRFLYFSGGKKRVLDIVRNDVMNHGAEQLCLIIGTATREVHPAAFEVSEAVGHPHLPERRFAVLLKFDPVLKNWSICAEDDGPRSGALSTDTVNAYLRK